MKINKPRQSRTSRVALAVFVQRCAASVLEEETELVVACQKHAHERAHKGRGRGSARRGGLDSRGCKRRRSSVGRTKKRSWQAKHKLLLAHAHTQYTRSTQRTRTVSAAHPFHCTSVGILGAFISLFILFTPRPVSRG